VSVCLSVRPSVRPISYWLEDCPTCDWTEGRKGGEFSLSLINTNEEVSSLSLTHTHSNQEVNSHSFTHWNQEVSSHSHTLKSGGEFSHTHTLKWGGEFSLTHALKLGGDFSLTNSNEKVSSQSLTHPCKWAYLLVHLENFSKCPKTCVGQLFLFNNLWVSISQKAGGLR